MSNEQTIRELAYQIWEAEGRPDGQQDRHWSLAHKLSSQVARAEAAPATRVARSRPRAAAAAAADSPPPAPTRRGSARRPKKSEQSH